MPFLIVRGSDNGDNGRKKALTTKILSVFDQKKTSVDLKYLHQSDYNYLSYNGDCGNKQREVVEKVDDLEREAITEPNHLQFEDSPAMEREMSSDELPVNVKGASRDMRDVLDLRVSSSVISIKLYIRLQGVSHRYIKFRDRGSLTAKNKSEKRPSWVGKSSTTIEKMFMLSGERLSMEREITAKRLNLII